MVHILLARDYQLCPAKRTFFFNMNPLLTKLVWSRWLRVLMVFLVSIALKTLMNTNRLCNLHNANLSYIVWVNHAIPDEVVWVNHAIPDEAQSYYSSRGTTINVIQASFSLFFLLFLTLILEPLSNFFSAF